MNGLVTVFIGSDSDYETVKPALDQLSGFGIAWEIVVSSAHRSPERTRRLVREAESKGAECLIAAAGCAAHLAGVIASETTLPVIGIPIDASSLKGMDALLATVQMPSGIPVATMAVGQAGARNAAVLAARILAIKYPEIKRRLNDHQQALAEQVEVKNKRLQERLAAG
ncbi:MAG: 5-(carboxyamino)imidazole ribonucleotide mutase [bacterium]